MVLNQIKDQIGVIFFSPSGFRAILDLMPKQLFSQLHVSIRIKDLNARYNKLLSSLYTFCH